MYKATNAPDGSLWSSEGEKLSTQDINNMILVLLNPTLSQLFTETELTTIKMTVKTHVIEKAYSVLYEVPNEKKEEIENENRSGKTFRKKKDLLISFLILIIILLIVSLMILCIKK